jgi:hypothetical protein
MAASTKTHVAEPKSTTPTPPPRVRRKPGLIALGIALASLGALMAAWLVGSATDTKTIIEITEGVDRGAVISADSLGATSINADSQLATVPASELDSISGKVAVSDLVPGSVLTPDSFTEASIPGAGETLVNVFVAPAQVPTQTMRSGQVVRIVSTPRSQDDATSGAQPTIQATVVSTTFNEDSGSYGVDVTVPSATASELAAWVATGRVAIIVDSEATK